MANFVLTLFAICISIAFIFTLVSVFTVGRRFDKDLKHLPSSYLDPQLPIFSNILRAITYSSRITFRGNPQKDRFYPNYDFRSKTTVFERLISYVTTLAYLATALLGVFWWIGTKFF